MTARKIRSKEQQQNQPQNSSFFDFFRPGESYTSLVLGIVVIIIAAVLILSFVRGKNVDTAGETQTDILSDESEPVEGVQIVDGEKTYKVQAGDDLWKIAEKVYKDGYKWSEIAKANNLTDPSLIHVDNVLKLPDVQQKASEMEAAVTPLPSAKTDIKGVAVDAKITGKTYQVQKGDYLWEIAVRAYGDGFKWVEIAKANSLVNPDVIFAGTELKLVR